MWNIAQRNLKIYFRDRSAVFFSLLAVFIIIGLYVLFLGDNLANSLKDAGEYAKPLVNNWIVAGLLAVTSITTTMGAFGIMVEDRAKKMLKDFAASPIKRSSLAGGYILSSVFIGIIISIVALILIETYVVVDGGQLLTLLKLLQVLGIIVLSVISGTALVFFLVTFFRSQNAFATASTVIGTLIGFITGIYIPIGSLPDAVQFVIKVFPVSHAAVLFRQVFMEQSMADAFANAPAEVSKSFQETMGVTYSFGDFTVSPLMSILVLLATTVIFYLLAILNLSRKNK
ncbi:ABC transporter permease [Paenibacillus albiflavus]|uniref:ABC transporter permease n=1 Tax=Paenibacillus albiflavus TaxID=2545760 RepID=A0A4R4E7S6_9BACL|nr:ABC transporter permease [Paenibacillus albiflavus]TCZ75804.1 ABC transporter permease [Paenibacillus albiflavus]